LDDGITNKNRGNEPASYDDDGLRQELERVRMRLKILPGLKSSLRKLSLSRLHHLEKELARRVSLTD